MSDTGDTFTLPSSQSSPFPLTPEGVHSVVIARALIMREINKFKPEAGPQPVIKLMLESDQKYTNDRGEEKNYNLFMKFAVSDHEKSTMNKFFNSVAGINVPLDEKKQITMKTEKELKDKNGEVTELIHVPVFEKGIRFSALVKQYKRDDGDMGSGVDSVFASTEQKTLNTAIFLMA